MNLRTDKAKLSNEYPRILNKDRNNGTEQLN